MHTVPDLNAMLDRWLDYDTAHKVSSTPSHASCDFHILQITCYSATIWRKAVPRDRPLSRTHRVAQAFLTARWYGHLLILSRIDIQFGTCPSHVPVSFTDQPIF